MRQHYQIRVLQPTGATLATDIAGLIQTATGTNINTRTHHSRKHPGHQLVYLDLTTRKDT